LALAAKNAGVKHYLYSSLGDHSRISNGKWKFPGWAVKYVVEDYIRTLDNFPATFVYVGGYFENFNQNIITILKLQQNGSILMSGLLDPHAKHGYLDVERDLGPAIVNILKQGPTKWNHKRIPLAFENVSMEEIATRFSNATGIKVIYEQAPKDFFSVDLVGLDHAIGVLNDGIYFDWDCKVPDEGRELNPNWHSVEDFAKDSWKKPEA
jgi:hypothetical protein